MSQTNPSRSVKPKNTRVPTTRGGATPVATTRGSATPTATSRGSAAPTASVQSPIEQSDLSGLLLVAISSALFLSLLSAARPSNWVGPVGAFFSDLLLDGIGIGAYPVVLGMLALSFVWLSGKSYTPALRPSVYFLALFVSTLALLSLITTSEFQRHTIGGWVGGSIRDLSISLFSTIGSAIVLSTFFLSSLFLFANWKFRHAVHVLGATGGLVTKPVFWMARGVRDAVKDAREAWNQRNQLEEAAQEQEDTETDENQDDDEEMLDEVPVPLSASKRLHLTRSQDTEFKHISSLAPISTVLEEKHLRANPRNQVVVVAPTQEDLMLEPEELGTEESEESEVLGVPSSQPSIVATREIENPTTEIKEEKQNIIAQTSENIISTTTEQPSSPKLTTAAAQEVTSTKKATVMPNLQTQATATTEKIVDVPVLTIVEPKARPKLVIPNEDQPREAKEYQLPPLSFLDYKEPESRALDRDVLTTNARKLEQKLLDYHIPGNVVEIHPGPVITMYEFAPGPGIKVSRIASLTDDLAMALEAERVRIIAPIPGKSVVGIEIPNSYRETVYLKEILADQSFKKVGSGLALGLGKDVAGNARSTDLAKMPHLLVAGATGSGKSVAVNTMICSILFNATPKEVRFLMIDPKMLELSIYEGIPHLLLPVVTDMKKAALALRWAVDEMERRYQLLAEAGVRNITNYNNKIELQKQDAEKTTEEGTEKNSLTGKEPLPYIVVIIDELADLMMVASRDVETSIARLAQMARAAGIHLILATQRPSVDVITGLIKANFPTRMSFQVASKIDSRTILDQQGAENLLGMGDMLLMERGKMVRLHGALVLEEEIHTLVEFLKTQGMPQYDESILAPRDEDGEVIDGGDDDEKDALYDQALAIVLDTKQASTSMVQRRLRIGYNRAARIIEQMERDGIVGPADGAKPREVLYRAAE